MALAAQCRVQSIKGKFERYAEPSHDYYFPKPSNGVPQQSYNRHKQVTNHLPKVPQLSRHILNGHDNNLEHLKNSRNGAPPSQDRNQLYDTHRYSDKESLKDNDEDTVSNTIFSTFAEKQKLVENIVLNIKKSKKVDVPEEKCPKSKNGLSTLFDPRDMMDVFEKGVRKFSIGKKEPPDTVRKGSKTSEVDCDNSPINKRKTKLMKNINNKRNDDFISKPITENGSIYMNDTNSRFNDKNSSVPFYDNVYDYKVEEPLRPPRKRITKKKNMAPSPPTMARESNHTPDNFIPTDNDPVQKKYSENRNFTAHQQKLSTPERERSSDEDPFPSYCRDPFFINSDKIKHGKSRNNDPHKDSIDGLPDGPPPRKPPRTFVHDIYRQAKPFEPNAKAQINIEDLYTKPIKKQKNKPLLDQKEKTVSFIEPKHVKTPGNKPQVAPKPMHLTSQKRFSVIEPMESVPPEFNESKTSIKRNSSFRFSFRKSKRSSPSPTRLSHVSKLRQIARSWTRLKAPEEKPNVRSKSEEYLYKKPVKRIDDRIYDVPYDQPRERVDSEELHYMVSPLFPIEDSDTTHPELSSVNSPIDKTKRSWDGMKNEFRQSCRNVQRRLKVAVR